jgi:hypothetical protein
MELMERLVDTRAGAIFEILTLALPDEDPKKMDGKIKRKLARAKLGPYDQAEVDTLRALHDALAREIRKFNGSQYYRGTPGRLADLDDFDYERMVRDFGTAFPGVSEIDLRGIVGFAIFAYYMK